MGFSPDGIRFSRAGVRKAGYLGGLLLVLGGLVSFFAGDKDLERSLPLRSIHVEGRFQHISAEQVRAAVLPYVGAGFVGADLVRMQDALLMLPWVHAAHLRRVWPDVLAVIIDEERAIARWGDKALVNAQGVLFYPADIAGMSALPVVVLPLDSGRLDVAIFNRLARILAPLNRSIRLLQMDRRSAVILTLDDGVRLLLGREDQSQRLHRFVRFFPRLSAAETKGIDRVDLRYSNGFAIGRQDKVAHG